MNNKIIAIAAITYDGILGVDNQLAVKSSYDMNWFKTKTTGNTVLMGRKTFESMGSKGLPNRDNIVVTTQDLGHTDHTFYYTNSLMNAFKYQTQKEKRSDLYVIGGAELYKQLIPMCDEVYLTIFKPVDPTTEWAFWSYDNAVYFPYSPNLTEFQDDAHFGQRFGICSINQFFQKYEILDRFEAIDHRGIVVRFSK